MKVGAGSSRKGPGAGTWCLHAIGGVPVDVELLGAGGLGAEEHRLQADEEDDGHAGGRLEAGEDEAALLN